jgi:hypothetical protein
MDIETMAYHGGHILRSVVRVLVCAVVCSAVQIGFHPTSAHNIAKIGMPTNVKSINKKCCTPYIHPKSRPIDDFIYLIARKSNVASRRSIIASPWVDDRFSESIGSGYGIILGLQRRIGPDLYSAYSGNAVCGGAPRIADYNTNGSWLIGDQFRGTRGVGVKVSTELTDFGISSDSSRIFCRFCEPISRLDGILSVDTGASHLGQLAADRIPLEQRGEERRYRYPSDYSRPNDQLASDRREPPRFPYQRVFLGICVIGVGWMCLWSSFEAFDKVSQSPRHIAGGIILGLIAILLIGHGLFYACLGVWGLPSLYVL